MNVIQPPYSQFWTFLIHPVTKTSKTLDYISPNWTSFVPSHHNNVQSSELWLPNWTSTEPFTTKTSKPPRIIPLPKNRTSAPTATITPTPPHNKKNNPLQKEPCLIHKKAPMSLQKRKAHGKLMQINHIANVDMKQLRQETLLRKYVCHICLRQMRLINEQLCKITTGKTQKCTYVKTAQKKKKKLVHLLQIAQ